jgi:hypothetical protein
MNAKLLFPILIVFAACFIMLLLAAKKGKGQTSTYRRRKLMTDNEEEFFGRLVIALPDHYVFPQVAMSAMLQPRSTNGRTAPSDRLRIAQQRSITSSAQRAARSLPWLNWTTRRIRRRRISYTIPGSNKLVSGRCGFSLGTS